MTELFVIVFKESNEVLTPKSYKKYWPNYGANDGLYGWRPPKKIYYNLGRAKCGFSHIPDQLKPYLKISKFVQSEDVIDGVELVNEQIVKKAKKNEEREKREISRERDLLNAKVEALNKRLKNYE